MHKKKRNFFNEFTVLGVFAAVATFGILYAGVSAVVTEFVPEGTSVVIPGEARVMSMEEYQDEAQTVLLPFFTQARVMTVEDIDSADPAFEALIGKTEDRLLGMRVPASVRGSHLSFVLLLEQWKRALDGSAGDREVVLDRTNGVIRDNPWLLEGDDAV